MRGCDQCAAVELLWLVPPKGGLRLWRELSRASAYPWGDPLSSQRRTAVASTISALGSTTLESQGIA
jgi:hypothetical protein